MSALHDPRLRASGLLELACGLRSFIERFDGILASYCSADPTEDATADPVEPDELTTVVLGMIALRDRIDGELSRAVVGARAVTQSELAPNSLEGLLR